MQVIQDRLGVAPNVITESELNRGIEQNGIVKNESNRGSKQSDTVEDEADRGIEQQDSIDTLPNTQSNSVTPLAETPKNDVENVEKSVEKSSKGSDNPYLKSMVADLLGDMSF